jgi:hypothetical protein
VPFYLQVKLITTWNQDIQSTGHLLISPGQRHEINFNIVEMLSKNGIAFGDRAFCSHKLFEQFIEMILSLLSVLNLIGNRIVVE